MFVKKALRIKRGQHFKFCEGKLGFFKMVFLGFSSLSIVRISIAKTIGPRIDTVRVSKTSVSKSAVTTIPKTTVSIGPVQSISISFSLSNMNSSNRVGNIAPTSSVAVGSCRANSVGAVHVAKREADADAL